jgi:hypothetical protein
MQIDWKPQMLKNPSQSPVVKIAATCQGWLDVLAMLIERALGWIPLALLALDAALVQSLGEGWWMQPNFQQFLATMPAR